VPDKLPSAYTIHKQRQLDDFARLVRRGSGSAYCPRDPKSDCTTAPEYTGICVIRGTLKDKPRRHAFFGEHKGRPLKRTATTPSFRASRLALAERADGR
jgi:hypothetical protein